MNFFNRSFFVFCSKKVFIILILLFVGFNFSLSEAKSVEKTGVLYSYKNVESYNTNNIISFQQAWKSFVETFEGTYLDYQFLCNISSDTKVQDINVGVIFYPLAIDISPEEALFLNEFVKGGGKLILTSGIGSPSENLKTFLTNHGINVKDNIIVKNTLNLKHKSDKVLLELPFGNFYSDFDIAGADKKIVANWKAINKLAIGGARSVIYVGYSWGQDIDKNNDIKTLIETLDYCWNDISVRLTKQISDNEYKTILKDINVLKQEAHSVIKITEQLDLPVPKYQLKKHFDNGIDLLNDFNSNYLFGNFFLARECATLAKNEFSVVYSLGIPVRKVEIRAIWLDRGTIVSMRSPAELRNLIKNLARVGFNIIFFETVNAGYPVYPSMLLPQNPFIKDWDPLKVAIDAAHSVGIELHAWVWTFAVGNTRHNLLVGEDVNYPGPILSTKNKDWALKAEDGSLRVELQPETWVSPANKEACNFLIELFSEIVRNYDVDGIQLDYIRFPFQKKHSQVGFDGVSKNAFKEITGKFPTVEGPVNKIWKEWKVKLISDFVQEASAHLKKIKPSLTVSTAVFALDRSLRMQLIQQDWETWLLNRWIDAVYPFYYSFTKDEIETKLTRAQESINHSAIIIPAFNLRVLSIGEFAERITQAKNIGVLGTALFAAEHLNLPKSELLKIGPYREKAPIIPYSNPLLACQTLLNEFSLFVEKFTVTKNRSVLADSQTQKEVYYLTKELKEDFKNFTPDKASAIEQKIINLQLKVKDWLSLEKYLDREQRAMYLSSYLEQIRTLINYIK